MTLPVLRLSTSRTHRTTSPLVTTNFEYKRMRFSGVPKVFEDTFDPVQSDVRVGRLNDQGELSLVGIAQAEGPAPSRIEEVWIWRGIVDPLSAANAARFS